MQLITQLTFQRLQILLREMNPGAEPQARGWCGRQGVSGTGSSAKLAWRKVGQAEVSRQGEIQLFGFSQIMALPMSR